MVFPDTYLEINTAVFTDKLLLPTINIVTELFCLLCQASVIELLLLSPIIRGVGILGQIQMTVKISFSHKYKTSCLDFFQKNQNTFLLPPLL